jgi:hypothetical protein
MTQNRYQAAIAAFDQANAEDPNKEMADGKEYPKELLYAQRMGEMQQRYAPGASEAVKRGARPAHPALEDPAQQLPMDKSVTEMAHRAVQVPRRTAGLMQKMGMTRDDS